jgi:hypothetical protein
MDGGIGNDTFHFTGAQNGDVVTVVGDNGGNDTLDLTTYSNNQLTDDGSTVVVDMGGGQSFTINYTDIGKISTADGDYPPGGIPVNTAPTADAGSVTLNEDTTATITLAGTDPDTGDAVENYRLDSLPANGMLKLNGSAVSAGDTVTQAEIDAGNLTFEPDADWNGSTNFSFSAHDGDDWSAGAATFTINVNADNDAPTPTAGGVTLDENTTATITLAGTDPDAGDAVETYRLDSLPANGTLKLNGNAVNAGDTVTQAQVDAGELTFEPDTDWDGNTNFTFSAHDGDDWSSSAATFSITVNDVGGGGGGSGGGGGGSAGGGAGGGGVVDDVAEDAATEEDADDDPVEVSADEDHDGETLVGEPTDDTTQDATAIDTRVEENENADGDATAAPTDDWDGTETLEVLNPMDHVADSVTEVRVDDHAHDEVETLGELDADQRGQLIDLNISRRHADTNPTNDGPDVDLGVEVNVPSLSRDTADQPETLPADANFDDVFDVDATFSLNPGGRLDATGADSVALTAVTPVGDDAASANPNFNIDADRNDPTVHDRRTPVDELGHDLAADTGTRTEPADAPPSGEADGTVGPERGGLFALLWGLVRGRAGASSQHHSSTSAQEREKAGPGRLRK